MRIIYFPDTDSVILQCEADHDKAVGKVEAYPIGENLVVVADEAGNLYQIEVMAEAAQRMNLAEIVAEGFRPRFEVDIPDN